MNLPEGAGDAIGHIPDDWLHALGSAASPERLASIAEFVAQERRSTRVLPDPVLVFAALAATPVNSVRAVILGQDPYPTATHAGMSRFVDRHEPLASIPGQKMVPGRGADDHVDQFRGGSQGWDRQGCQIRVVVRHALSKATSRQFGKGDFDGFTWRRFMPSEQHRLPAGHPQSTADDSRRSRPDDGYREPRPSGPRRRANRLESRRGRIPDVNRGIRLQMPARLALRRGARRNLCPPKGGESYARGLISTLGMSECLSSSLDGSLDVLRMTIGRTSAGLPDCSNG